MDAVRTKGGKMYEPKNLKGRTLAVIDFLFDLPEGKTVSPSDVAGYLAGYHGEGDKPQDEIEVHG